MALPQRNKAAAFRQYGSKRNKSRRGSQVRQTQKVPLPVLIKLPENNPTLYQCRSQTPYRVKFCTSERNGRFANCSSESLYSGRQTPSTKKSIATKGDVEAPLLQYEQSSPTNRRRKGETDVQTIFQTTTWHFAAGCNSRVFDHCGRRISHSAVVNAKRVRS